MIITTQILNNIETALTTPQVEGFYNVYMNNDQTGITCSYNTLLTQLQAGNLPVLVAEYEYEENPSGTSYTRSGFTRIILSDLYSEPDSINENQINYGVDFTEMISLIATDPTANMMLPQPEEGEED